MTLASSDHRDRASSPAYQAYSAGRYRSLAGTVRAYLLDVDGRGVMPIDSEAKGDLEAMRDLLAVGRRYRESGSLDTSGSSPDTIDLALELRHMAQGEFEAVSPDGKLNMRKWAGWADAVLADIIRGRPLDSAELDFLRAELLPLLSAWMKLPSEPIRE